MQTKYKIENGTVDCYNRILLFDLKKTEQRFI